MVGFVSDNLGTYTICHGQERIYTQSDCLYIGFPWYLDRCCCCCCSILLPRSKRSFIKISRLHETSASSTVVSFLRPFPPSQLPRLVHPIYRDWNPTKLTREPNRGTSLWICHQTHSEHTQRRNLCSRLYCVLLRIPLSGKRIPPFAFNVIAS